MLRLFRDKKSIEYHSETFNEEIREADDQTQQRVVNDNVQLLTYWIKIKLNVQNRIDDAFKDIWNDLSRSNLNAFHEEQRRILFLFKIVSLIENVSNRDTVNELKQYDDQINSTKIFDAHISNELD